jgi:hypothetical protein
MDRMSPLDASFLHIENEVSHMHIGSAGVFEGPAPSRDEMLEAVESKLHLVPRYRQKVRFPPLRLGPPVWVDDAHFNLEYHVRRTALASPGGEDGGGFAPVSATRRPDARDLEAASDHVVTRRGHSGAPVGVRDPGPLPRMRKDGFDGGLVLIGEESERPPLTREYLGGESPREKPLGASPVRDRSFIIPRLEASK